MNGNASQADVFSSIGMIAKALFGNPVPQDEPFWHDVKLVHADDLQKWGTFKEYSEHQSITYADYLAGVKRINALKNRVAEITRTQEKLAQLETEDLEKYDIIEISVPRSLFWRELEIPLPEPPYEKTKMTCVSGEIKNWKLYIRGQWKTQIALISRSCPSYVLHQQEIASLQQRLKEFPQEDLDIVDEIKTSRYTQPVLFISHRWESVTHPDPERHQYRKLSALSNCFMIYDYSSFPQRLTDEGEKAALQRVLANMNRLIKNVVILKSPTYIERGWCIYEYILASLTLSTVCDEIRASDFVNLRNLAATRPTLPENLFRGNSVDSAIQNSIATETLKTMNRILPQFNQSQFTVKADRETVTELLLDKLMAILPSKKEYPSPYLGEWIDVPWTREELRNAFQKEIQVEGLNTLPSSLKPYQLKVPNTLEEAMANNYALDVAPPNNPMTFLERITWELPAILNKWWLVPLLVIVAAIIQVIDLTSRFWAWVGNAVLRLPRQIAGIFHRTPSRPKH